MGSRAASKWISAECDADALDGRHAGGCYLLAGGVASDVLGPLAGPRVYAALLDACQQAGKDCGPTNVLARPRFEKEHVSRIRRPPPTVQHQPAAGAGTRASHRTMKSPDSKASCARPPRR